MIGPAVGVTPEFCAEIDTPNRCLFSGCAEWVRTEFVDPATCERTEVFSRLNWSNSDFLGSAFGPRFLVIAPSGEAQDL